MKKSFEYAHEDKLNFLTMKFHNCHHSNKYLHFARCNIIQFNLSLYFTKNELKSMVWTGYPTLLFVLSMVQMYRVNKHA